MLTPSMTLELDFLVVSDGLIPGDIDVLIGNRNQRKQRKYAI